MRISQIMQNQIQARRKIQLINSYVLRREMIKQGYGPKDNHFRMATRNGTYWGISTNITHYNTGNPLGHPIKPLKCPFKYTSGLAEILTRFGRFSSRTQERLINWGYAVCDAAMRKYVDTKLPAPVDFPYKGGVVE